MSKIIERLHRDFLVLTQLPRPEKVDENCIGVS